MNLIIFFVSSYFIGNILTAHFLIKIFHKGEILGEGSGNPGARNAGRLYGKKAFVLTFLGDALKGALVIFIGRMLELSALEQLIGLAFALIGHIRPVFFRFRGGKGISTYIGGALAFEPLLAVVIIIAFLITYPFTKSFTLSGLGSFLVLPVAVDFLHNSVTSMWGFIGITIIILLAHIKNLIEKWKS
ncbi:glycerol-3-phosphate acyltransferase [Cytobacillus massiliigabonensis]|uniref:glycerol-3-phosphate acyltransferase n=1 Tax=Cytobacillus massiliigabonensis TaxID=1871011 RepID=UPI000C844CB2|nr:glycerol-3-phosphate acyltransferase [Cytobacillus massiliigabonensis]